MANLKKVLKGQSVTEQIDAINENVEVINTDLEKVVNNDAGYITEKDIPVKKVNGKTGDVSLSAKDVGAFPNSSTIQELDINNIKETGVYIGTYATNPYYLLVIKYNDTNIYQELIGLKLKQYRRFTGAWSEWIKEYSTENPIKASDITGIELVDTDKELSLALLEDTTFVKADIKYNPSSKKLYIGDKEFATTDYVDNAVNMIKSIIVTELPATGVPNTIYFVPSGESGQNAFNEFIYVNGNWEIVGGTSIDLTPFLEKTVAEQTYAKISSLDEKVSKATTINGKTLYNNITLTAEDVGALPSDTKLSGDVVYRNTNAEIVAKLGDGEFIENDVVLATDNGAYKLGHVYRYNNGALTDITDIVTDYVALAGDQSIAGTKNFTGLLRYGGVNVATEDDIKDVEDKLPTIDVNLSTTSTNPVQNKAITTELNKKATQTALEELSSTVDLKASTSYVDDELDKKQNTITGTQLDALNSGIDTTKVAQISTNTSNISNLSSGKVDKVAGKGLSANDYTNEDKTKLAGLSNYDDTAISNRISTIENKIPTSASSTNKLADVNFVNSSISTATATFKGTFNSVNSLPTTGIDLNDYAFVVGKDAAGNTQYSRYKYNGSKWEFEYVLNNSSFTADQWSAINSGITTSLTGKISTNEANITNLNVSKVDKTTTINGESLTGNVTLDASDIACADNSGMDLGFTNTQEAIDFVSGGLFELVGAIEQNSQTIGTMQTSINELGTNVSNLQTNVAQRVPMSRTVNGKSLSANITLNATDVGALPSNTQYVKSINGQIGDVTGIALTDDIPDTSNFITKDVNDLTNYKNNTQLTSLLNTKQNTITSSNKLSSSLISGLGTASALNTGTASGNVPVLGSDGKLPSAVVPASAITNTFVASSQSAMLGLSSADVGDICVRTDLNKSFILKATPYSTLSNWQELLTPTDSVLSVNGQTGAVNLTATEISCVDNTGMDAGFTNTQEAIDFASGGLFEVAGMVEQNAQTIEAMGTALNEQGTTLSNLQTNVAQRVPTSRTINGKALTSNITLTASDVGALSSSASYVKSVNGSSGAVTDVAKMAHTGPIDNNLLLIGIDPNNAMATNDIQHANQIYIKDLALKSEIPDTSSFATTSQLSSYFPKSGGVLNTGATITMSGSNPYVGLLETGKTQYYLQGYQGEVGISVGGSWVTKRISLDANGKVYIPSKSIGDGTYTYTLPNKTGTIAMTSDLGTQATYSLSGTTLTITPK